MAHTGPLNGVKVLEFSLILSAPYGGMHLADMGAEVVKVEAPGGEPMRHISTVVPGNSKVFQSVNRGKRSVVVDLHHPRGREVIYRLVPNFDVVLINYRPGVPKRLGIDYETLAALHPRLIYADISGFGTRGPLAHRAASDIVAQAYSGAIATDAKLDEVGAPVWMAIPVGDMPTGIAAALGIIAALYHRQRTGEGQRIDVSLMRTVMSILGGSLMREPVSDASNRDLLKQEMRRLRAAGGSYDALVQLRRSFGGTGTHFNLYFAGYRAKDGGLVLGSLTANNREAIQRVLEITDDPSDRPGFDIRDPANQQQVERLRAYIRQQMLTRTVAEWLAIFEREGAPVAPVNFPEDLADDPQASTLMVDLVHELTGPQRMAAPVVDFRHAPTAPAGAAPVLGDGTDDVLQRLGGFSAGELAALREQGAVA